MRVGIREPGRGKRPPRLKDYQRRMARRVHSLRDRKKERERRRAGERGWQGELSIERWKSVSFYISATCFNVHRFPAVVPWMVEGFEKGSSEVE